MKVALAHDYLIQMGGAERVVAAMHRAFARAPIFTSAVNRKTLSADFLDADIRTSWMQMLPLIRHHRWFKAYFLLYPAAFRSFPPVEADAAWISCSAFAKFLRFTPGTRKVCYLHNVTRFLWQTDDYIDHEVRRGVLNRTVRSFLPALREADREATTGFDVLVANSRNVQARIKRFYGLDSIVINPPVETSRFQVSTRDEGYHLIVSRLLGYKHIDLAVQAFTKTNRRLVVIGDGPHLAHLKSIAGPGITFAGRLPDASTRDHFERCRAFILPGEEDFGITPLEAMACGKPVVAFARGGARETVVDNVTGTFFNEPTPESLIDAVERCESATWDAIAIRRHADAFSTDVFRRKMSDVLLAGDRAA